MGAAREMVIRWGPIPGTAQERFFDDDTSDADLLFTGGWASGKTMTLTAKMLKLSAINAPLPGIWCVPDYAHIHDTILPTLTDTDPDTGDPWFLDPSQYHYHEHRHVLTWEGGGPIQFVTAENPKSIAGPNVAFAGVDEPGSIKQEAWRNTSARVRHPSAVLRQRVAAGTPEGLGWLMDLVDVGRVRVYRMATTENSELLRHNPAYLDQVRANASEAELAAYLHGEFTNMTGALAYPAFSVERQMRPLDLNRTLPLRISFDFNVDPMTAVVGQQWAGPAGLEFGVVRAVALMASTVMDVCAKLLELYPSWPAGVWIYGDASGKHRSHLSLKSNYHIIQELLGRMGPLTMKVPTANPPVATRINTVNRLCQDARGIVRLWLSGDPEPSRRKDAPTAFLVRSLQQTVKKSGTDDVWKKPGETVTHLGEALGYWLTAEAPAQKPEMAAIAIRATSRPTASHAMQAIRDQKSARLRRELEAMQHV